MAMERSIGEANRAAIASAVTALQLFDEVLPGVAINDPKAVIGGGQLAASASSSSSSSSSSRRATGGIDGHAWEKLRWLRGHLQNVIQHTDAIKRKLSDGHVGTETQQALEEENLQLRRQAVDEQKRTNVLKENLAEEIVRTVALTKEISEQKAQIDELQAVNNKLQEQLQRYKERANVIVIDGESDMPRKKQRKKPTPPWPVGTVIRKSFPQGDFIGQVISYNKPYYKIRYEDEDEEEMTAAEVGRYLVSVPTTTDSVSAASSEADDASTAL